MSDSDFDRRIRDHFASGLRGHAPRDFDSMLAQAEARTPSRILPWIVPALAASVVIAALVLRGDRESGDPRATAQLVAELSASTHWTAPSDRWLGRQMPAQFRTLPDFDRMTTPLEDTKEWL